MTLHYAKITETKLISDAEDFITSNKALKHRGCSLSDVLANGL
jgi:hypothetical protein